MEDTTTAAAWQLNDDIAENANMTTTTTWTREIPHRENEHDNYKQRPRRDIYNIMKTNMTTTTAATTTIRQQNTI